MFGEGFNTWSIDPFPNTTFITVSMHVISLRYLEDGSLYFTELPDSGTEELNRMLVGLDTTAVIPNIDK